MICAVTVPAGAGAGGGGGGGGGAEHVREIRSHYEEMTDIYTYFTN